MDFCSLSAPRIAEERKRLGFNQEAAGATCGISREMWGKYERGKAAMGGDVLMRFAAAGADVQYIITGVRSSVALAPDERLLIDRYRQSPQPLKDAALRVVLGGGDSGPPSGGATQTFHAPVRGGVAGRDIVNKEKK
ncbi:MAG TPA: helix-turn-helix transcriptional regulator [Paucimonas sp.]|nr:helix-turn-helix transcriptional regulator [Paucimonas sp.]